MPKNQDFYLEPPSRFQHRRQPTQQQCNRPQHGAEWYRDSVILKLTHPGWAFGRHSQLGMARAAGQALWYAVRARVTFIFTSNKERAPVPQRASLVRRAIDEAWLVALGAAAQEIAAQDFPTRLLHLLGSLIRHDMALVVRYVEEAPPDFLVCEGLAPHLVELYRAGLWRYDPFYGFWHDHREGGVASLREILPPLARRGYYHRVFQRRQAKIEDELGLFLPTEATGSIGLFLERSTGSFSREETRLAAALAPVMAGLYRAHRLVAGTAALPAALQAPQGVDGRALDLLARRAVEQSPVPLTRREREIIALILSGQPSLGIAGKLGISRGTVKNHRRRIYRKFHIASERELFVIFLGQRHPQ